MHASPSTTAEHDQTSPECCFLSESPETDSFELLDLTGDEDSANDARNTQSTEIGNNHLAKWGIDGEEYEVEAIIRHEIINGTPHYRVKWQGWPSSANTWEPIGSLGQCKDLIEEFHQPRRRRAR